MVSFSKDLAAKRCSNIMVNFSSSRIFKEQANSLLSEIQQNLQLSHKALHDFKQLIDSHYLKSSNKLMISQDHGLLQTLKAFFKVREINPEIILNEELIKSNVQRYVDLKLDIDLKHIFHNNLSSTNTSDFTSENEFLEDMKANKEQINPLMIYDVKNSPEASGNEETFREPDKNIIIKNLKIQLSLKDYEISILKENRSAELLDKEQELDILHKRLKILEEIIDEQELNFQMNLKAVIKINEKYWIESLFNQEHELQKCKLDLVKTQKDFIKAVELYVNKGEVCFYENKPIDEDSRRIEDLELLSKMQNKIIRSFEREKSLFFEYLIDENSSIKRKIEDIRDL